jgi:hypothetical protein
MFDSITNDRTRKPAVVVVFNKVMIRILGILLLIIGLAGCSSSENYHTAVYLLLDTSGTYTKELDEAKKIINFYLATLKAGDSLAVARIDSGSFSEKDIVAKVTFDDRPSRANVQKREFMAVIDHFVKTVQSASYTDISGGLLQAQNFVRETGAGQKHVLIFSDLKEELPAGFKRDFALELDGFVVTALNVTKLRSDNRNPEEYQTRMSFWQDRIEEAGGRWRIVNDLDREGALDLSE